EEHGTHAIDAPDRAGQGELERLEDVLIEVCATRRCAAHGHVRIGRRRRAGEWLIDEVIPSHHLVVPKPRGHRTPGFRERRSDAFPLNPALAYRLPKANSVDRWK